MARKIFLSVLGTGFYEECVYRYGQTQQPRTRFIQEATLRAVADDWTADDRIVILLTDQARRNNWSVAGDKRRNRMGEEEPYVGLQKVLADLGLKAAVEGVAIPGGKDDAEMWQIFDTAYQLLHDGDELYLDLTHSFRYLPMLMVVLAGYAKFLKRVRVASVTYGNYEARANGVAPIMSLAPLLALQDWAAGVADYLKHGDAQQLATLGKEELRPILKEAKGKDEAANTLRALVSALPTMMDELAFCRGKDIVSGHTAATVRQQAQASENQYLKAFVPLLQQIEQTASVFQTDDAANFVAAADLCYQYGHYQSAVTLLLEGTAAWVAQRNGWNCTDKVEHQLAKQALKKKSLQLDGKEAEYRPYGNEAQERKVGEVAAHLSEDIAAFYEKLSDDRNDFNHAGLRDNARSAAKLRKLIGERIDKAKQLLCASESSVVAKAKVFVNFSNHPYNTWPDEQKEAARAYGDCIDLPFPSVDPEAAACEIAALADDSVGEIKALAHGRDCTVHVMGEMCLTHAVVSRLQRLGIRCVASTSYRLATDAGNGRKYVEFQFKRFREYDC